MCSKSFALSLIGSVLLVAGIIIHVVCVATPYMVGVDLESVKEVLIRNAINADPMPRGESVKELKRQIGNSVPYKFIYGPWKLCRVSRDDIACNAVKSPDSWLEAVQAFSVLAVLLAGVAFIMSVINIFSLRSGNWKRPFSVVACILAFAAGATIVIEICIVAMNYGGNFFNTSWSYGAKEKPEDMTYLKWGFGVEIVAVLVFMVGGLIHLVARREVKMDEV